MRYLPNPERACSSPPADGLDRAEVTSRLGPTNEPFEVLSGGLANTNVRVGDRVLRVYRRDAAAARKEAFLLERGWTSFRVPRVLDAGRDFLVLEYVPHGPVEASAECGAAVGRALAEIHAGSFDVSGFLGADGAVIQPFASFFDAMRGYVTTQLQGPGDFASVLDRTVALLDAHERTLRSLEGRPRLLHGDFKATNLHWTDGGELLVLDWEFAYAGPALMDVGQLVRWAPPSVFLDAFAESYRASGGELAADWMRWAAVFDLVNLLGLLARAPAGTERAALLRQRLLGSLRDFDFDAVP